MRGDFLSTINGLVLITQFEPRSICLVRWTGTQANHNCLPSCMCWFMRDELGGEGAVMSC